MTEVLAAADVEVVTRASELVGSLGPLDRCADIEVLRAAVEPPLPDEADAVEQARDLLAQARAMRSAGRYESAYQRVQQAKQGLSNIGYEPVRTELAVTEGSILEHMGRYPEADAALTEALRLAGKWRQVDEMREAALRLPFVVGFRQHRFEEALGYRELIEGLTHGDPRAEAAGHNNLAIIVAAQGNHAEAEKMFRRGLELREQVLGTEHPKTAESLANVASVLLLRGKVAQAEAMQRRGIEIEKKALGPEHPRVVSGLNNVAVTQMIRGENRAAEQTLRELLAISERSLGPEHAEHAMFRMNLGFALLGLERHVEAAVEFERALAISAETLGPGHRTTLIARGNLARALHAQGKPARAEAELRVALEQRDPSDGDTTAGLRTELALVLLDRNRIGEALHLAEQAWAHRQEQDSRPSDEARTAFALARILWKGGPDRRTRVRARGLAELAHERYREAPGFTGNRDPEEVEQWLATHRAY